MSLLLAAALLLSEPAPPPPATAILPSAPSAAARASLDQATRLIASGNPGEAIPIVDQVIRTETPAPDGKIYFSAGSLPELLLYTAMGNGLKRPTIVLDGTLAEAHFLRAYAQVELHRPDDAKADLDRAVELAPMNSLYLSERGEWYKNRRDWDRSFADFKQAEDAAALTPATARDKARAYRGMAFVRVEQHRYVEARKLLREALAANPGDELTKRDFADLAARERR